MKKTCILTVIIFLLLGLNSNSSLISKTNKVIKSNSKSISKIKRNSKPSKIKKSKLRKSKILSNSNTITGNYTKIILSDTSIGDGVQYTNMLIGRGRNKHSVHIISADLTNQKVGLTVLKANNNATELMKLQEITRNYEFNSYNKILGAINANFWKAYTNNPIGTTVINGEVVELNPYKEWTSCFIDANGIPFIDNFKTSASIQTNKSELNISSINRRRDSTGIVIYNKFAGNFVPMINQNSIEKLKEKAAIEMLEFVNDSIYNDSTEFFDYQEYEVKLIAEQRANSIEHSLYKAVAIYLDKPAINKEIRIKILSIDTGTVLIPEDGIVISFGHNIPYDMYPKVNSIVKLNIKTDKNPNIEFYNSICGTPRLVRNGVAKHEATIEGSKARRFINKPLPRTAIGFDKTKSQIYLVTVESSSNGNKAANLQDMANIMKQIGCWNAMNLDGGGSSLMVVNHQNIMAKGRPESGRKISVGFAIIQKNEFNAEDKRK